MEYKEYLPKNKYMIDTFAGINDHEHISTGEWQDALNMTCDEYPAVKTRERRVTVTARGDVQMASQPTYGIYIHSSGIKRYWTDVYVESVDIFPQDGPFTVAIDGNRYSVQEIVPVTTPIQGYSLLMPADDYEDVNNAWLNNKKTVSYYGFMMEGSVTDAVVIDEGIIMSTNAGYLQSAEKKLELGGEIRQMAAMGRKIFTDNGYLTDDSLDSTENAGAELEMQQVEITLCNSESENITVSFEPLQNPSDGDYWFDADKNGLYRWSDTWGEWVSVSECYIKVQVPTAYDTAGLRAGDAVRMMGGGEDRAYVIHSVTAPENNADGFITLNGILNVTPPQDETVMTSDVMIKRRLPNFDFICEHDNRIWGCRYGENDDGEFVNEIYASALGDPLNWFLYEGTAADSWTASVGAPGPWTGCCSLGEYVLFFKADRIFMVSGSEPSSFRYTQLDDYGVQPGSSKSICVIDNYAYYKSEHGVMRIGWASYPTCISRALGYDRWTQAVAGADGRKYYISMADTSGRHMYVYDTETGTWMKETDAPANVNVMVRYKNNLMCISSLDEPALTDLRLEFDAEASAEGRRTETYINWLKIFWYTQARILYNTVQLALESEQESISEIKAYYEGLIEDGDLYARIVEIPHSSVVYTYLSNEKTKDMIMPTGNVYYRTEDAFDWYAETGLLGLEEPDHKRMRIAQIRRKTGQDGVIICKIKYDGDDEWTELWRETGKKTGTIRVSFPPSCRCDMYRLRFEGTGDTVIYSVTINQEDSGDYVR